MRNDPGGRLPPWLLVLGAVVSVQVGGALAARLVPVLGAGATVMLRLLAATAMLWAVARPRLRGHTRQAWQAVLLFGGVLAAMNLTFYASLGRLPIGVAVTVEFLGPLLVAAVGTRRWVDGVAVATALVGVAFITRAVSVPWRELDGWGLALAAMAGVCWAAYILCSRTVGRHFPALDGLTVAMTVAAVLITPIGLLTARAPLLRAEILGMGAVVALMSSVLPYSLELIALRRMSPTTFGVLLSLEPAVAAFAGLVILGQRLTGGQLLGIAMVVAASVLIMATQRRHQPTDITEVGGGATGG